MTLLSISFNDLKRDYGDSGHPHFPIMLIVIIRVKPSALVAL